LRLDKFLVLSRLIKRRSLAQEFCEKGCVKIGDRVAKPSTTVSKGDRLILTFGRKTVEVEVLEIPERPNNQAIRKINETMTERG